MTALPAVVRMQLRGFRFDRDAHAALIEDLSRERIETIDAYVKACREHGVDDSVPETPERKRTILEAILTSAEIANWARTEKSHALSTRRSELKRAVHYPPIAALVRLSILDKAISAFGENYAESVSVVTGRIHSSYWVASTASGRASCTKPNLQQLPRDKRFRALFKAAPGCRSGRRRLQRDGIKSRRLHFRRRRDDESLRGRPRSPSHHRRGHGGQAA